MSSEKKKTRIEEILYEPIKEVLTGTFSRYIIPPKKPYLQGASYERPPERLYLELIGDKRGFSEKLKQCFEDETLHIINSEGKYPDIIGFVKRKENSREELITVEIKAGSIKLRDIMQARLYKELFKAKFGLLISASGITEERVRFLLDNDIGKWIRGEVIIMRYYKNFHQKGRFFEMHPRFKNKVPEIFKKYCKP